MKKDMYDLISVSSEQITVREKDVKVYILSEEFPQHMLKLSVDKDEVKMELLENENTKLVNKYKVTKLFKDMINFSND